MTREDIVKKYPKIFVGKYMEAPVAWLAVIDDLCSWHWNKFGTRYDK